MCYWRTSKRLILKISQIITKVFIDKGTTYMPRNEVSAANHFLNIIRKTRGQYKIYSDSKVHGSNMGLTWVMSAPDGPHVGPMDLTIMVSYTSMQYVQGSVERCALKYFVTHPGWVMHIFVRKIKYHWFRYWFVTWSTPSHYLNKCQFIINWTIGKKFQWNLNKNLQLFIPENAFKMSCAISRKYVWKCRLRNGGQFVSALTC